jgi:predicted nucleotide-binding protein
VEKAKNYTRTLFSADVVREAFEVYKNGLPKGSRSEDLTRSVALDGVDWEFDSNEEFFAAYRKCRESATFSSYSRTRISYDKNGAFRFSYNYGSSRIVVESPRAAQIEAVFDVFERNAAASRIPEPLPTPEVKIQPKIFIGHGRSVQWRDLKDHLTDKHGYQVVAYEVGARAGHTIRDILDEMLAQSSFALLVMTGEDSTGDGQVRARQNIVHELGLFQGKLGFARAIVVVEHDAELFSNIDGVQQLRFNRGNIAEVYGDVLATLYREFGDAR